MREGESGEVNRAKQRNTQIAFAIQTPVSAQIFFAENFDGDLVVLEDPEGLFLASNVVPVVSGELPDGAAEIINAVSAALTPEGLVALNVQSTVDQESTPDIAKAWLTENGLI